MNTPSSLFRSICSAALLASLGGALVATAADVTEKPAAAIQDNSFLVEEAYNQEPGIVQNILTMRYDVDRQRGSDDREFVAAFTQEIPVFSQLHQFSYTIPFARQSSGGSHHSGLGDVFLNYRYQALFEDDLIPAFAPRVSLVLPTGNRSEGLGNGAVGYQVNLPFSKIVHDQWTVHFNAGSTLYPGMRDRNPVSFNLGAGVIYAVTPDFNLMVETLADWIETPLRNGNMDRSFEALISPGARYAFNLPKAQIVVGAAVPVGLTHETPDIGGFLYFSYESRLWGREE